jgi:hypothetical protein
MTEGASGSCRTPGSNPACTDDSRRARWSAVGQKRENPVGPPADFVWRLPSRDYLCDFFVAGPEKRI